MVKKNKTTVGIRRLWLIVLLPISFIINGLAATSEPFLSFYCENIYPLLSGSINYFFSQTSISIAEIIIIIFASLIIVMTIGTILKILFGKNKLKSLLAYTVNIICIASVIYFGFTVTCGINYYRPSFSEQENLDIGNPTESELIALAENLAEKLNEADIAFDRIYMTFEDTASRAAEYTTKLTETYQSLSGEYSKPKAVNFFGLMSYSQITGFFFPFTYEANVNGTIPKMSLPFTMCHELVHVRGFMREDEANYIAYLICVESEDPEFIYSGLLSAYSYTANALYKQNPQAYISVSSQLNDKVKSDLQERKDYWSKYEGIVADVSDKVNDTYLKANAQSDGTESYGKMVDLLIAEMRKTK